MRQIDASRYWYLLLTIQDLSALQELKGHLTTAINVLSNIEEQSTGHRLDAIRSLNSFKPARWRP